MVLPDQTRSGERPRNKPPWSWIFLLSVLASCLGLGIFRARAPLPPPPEAALRQALPDAVRFEESLTPFTHYLGFDSQGGTVGYVLITDAMAPRVRGYLGEIGSALGLTSQGRITAVIPFRHRETPYYMEMVTSSGLVDRMAGLDLKAPFPALDAVSGATVSSRAFIRDVRESAVAGVKGLLSLPVPPTEERAPGAWAGWKTLLTALLLAGSLAAGFAAPRGPLRETVRALNLVGIGVVVNTPLTLSALSRTLSLDFPGPGNPLLFLLFAYLLLSVPLQGRAYCRLVCPFGTLQQVLNRLSPWQVRPGPVVASRLPAFRRFVLGAFLLAGAGAGLTGFTEVEPFFGLFTWKLSFYLWIVVIFIMVVSVFWRRFWCDALCPTGTCLSVLCRAARPVRGKADEVV